MKLKATRKRTGLHLTFALSAMLLGAGVSNASPITYDVNQTIGIGSVTGTITTDGATGSLISGDITDWNLDLKDGVKTFNLTGSNSTVVVSGSDVTATATDLYFDFDATDAGYLLFEVNLASGAQYYCDASKNQDFWCSPGASVVPGSVFDNPATWQNARLTGNEIIGTVPGIGNPAPEPATFLLVGLGLAAVGFMRRRKAG